MVTDKILYNSTVRNFFCLSDDYFIILYSLSSRSCDTPKIDLRHFRIILVVIYSLWYGEE